MPTISLEVQTFPVAGEILALPGDTILVYNGICIGTREGRKSVPKAPTTNGAQVPEPSVEAIVAFLRQHGPSDTRHIADGLGIPRHAYTPRAAVGRILRGLTKRKAVSIYPSEREKHLIYQIGAH